MADTQQENSLSGLGGFLSTLKREGKAAGEAVAGMPSAIYHAAADPETAEESAKYGKGFEKKIGPTGRVIDRTMVQPALNAAHWYYDAAKGKVVNPYEQFLSVAPEGIGGAVGAVVAGKAGARAFEEVKTGVVGDGAGTPTPKSTAAPTPEGNISSPKAETTAPAPKAAAAAPALEVPKAKAAAAGVGGDTTVRDWVGEAREKAGQPRAKVAPETQNANLQLLHNYEKAYGPLKGIPEAERSGNVPMSESTVDTINARLLRRMGTGSFSSPTSARDSFTPREPIDTSAPTGEATGLGRYNDIVEAHQGTDEQKWGFEQGEPDISKGLVPKFGTKAPFEKPAMSVRSALKAPDAKVQQLDPEQGDVLGRHLQAVPKSPAERTAALSTIVKSGMEVPKDVEVVRPREAGTGDTEVDKAREDALADKTTRENFGRRVPGTLDRVLPEHSGVQEVEYGTANEPHPGSSEIMSRLDPDLFKDINDSMGGVAKNPADIANHMTPDDDLLLEKITKQFDARDPEANQFRRARTVAQEFLRQRTRLTNEVKETGEASYGEGNIALDRAGFRTGQRGGRLKISEGEPRAMKRDPFSDKPEFAEQEIPQHEVDKLAKDYTKAFSARSGLRFSGDQAKGTITVTDESGKTVGGMTAYDLGESLRISASGLPDNVQGLGLGQGMYMKLFDMAKSAGKESVESGGVVSEKAANTWRALKKKGLPIEETKVRGPQDADDSGSTFKINLKKYNAAIKGIEGLRDLGTIH